MGAKWPVIAAKLEARIASGEFPPGAELPSEPELVTQELASRETVRKAYGSLEARGLVEGAPGRRRTVAVRHRIRVHVARDATRVAGGQAPTLGADAWMHDGTAAGVLSGPVRVSAHEAGGLAGALGLDPGAGVFTREVVRRVNGHPWCVARWTFPRWLAAGTRLAAPDEIDRGSVAYLAGLGHRPVHFTVEFDARMPSPAEVVLLAMPPGVPVQIVRRAGFTAAPRRAVLFEETVWPTDRVTLAMDLGDSGPPDRPGERCER